ncbi:hypothetical protein E5161_03805 [Cohnella pontilimi]|uniref:Uridine kinase n=1 Tax=Cohnella pontilimi TaxID=2564100 RepID=A0A4U0FLR0_9BACL|nr:hypothetical protein [Cohnella pontilimi]TJY44512.1 hypothetical protein E5161_03805 [Cohnella pontilimi]
MSQQALKAVESIVSIVKRRLVERTGPLVVAIDGGSGAGKSMLAADAALYLGATVIQCDDFFRATITDEEWDTYTPEQKCLRCIDWQRMRTEVLSPLLAGHKAQYHPFSFSSGNGLASHFVTVEPSNCIILDGIYSALPVLSDVVHLTILVNVIPELRRHRHNIREGSSDTEWHARWDAAEDYYFSELRPPSTFDLIVEN